jgi:hypothetical protein
MTPLSIATTAVIVEIVMPERNEEDEVPIPSFQAGGRVRETGIALVHEGEFISPASGSEAVIESSADAGVINYYFPVEIVMVGSLPEEEYAALETRIWESLGEAMERMT